jgi:hypothetical protein
MKYKKTIGSKSCKTLRELLSNAFLKISQRISMKEESPEKRRVYIVWDSLGDGRLAGIFKNFSDVEKMLKINPHYYRYYRGTIDEVFPDAMGWLDEEQRARLKASFTNMSENTSNLS